MQLNNKELQRLKGALNILKTALNIQSQRIEDIIMEAKTMGRKS